MPFTLESSAKKFSASAYFNRKFWFKSIKRDTNSLSIVWDKIRYFVIWTNPQTEAKIRKDVCQKVGMDYFVGPF